MVDGQTNEIDTSLVISAWIVLGIGWIIMFIPFTFTGIVGGFIAGICGTIMAIVNLVRGVTFQGILQMLAGVFLTPIIYILSWWFMLEAISADPAIPL